MNRVEKSGFKPAILCARRSCAGMTSQKEKRSAEEYLSDIRDAIRTAHKFSRDVTFEEFRTNREKQLLLSMLLRL